MSALAIPRRPLGKTGLQVSALAQGGHHLGDAVEFRLADQLVGEGIDGGIGSSGHARAASAPTSRRAP